MALEQITFNIGAFNDSDAGGNNYFVNKVFEVKNQSDNTFATIYADASGATQIPQNGIDNISNSRGECNFYIDDGDFYLEVDSQQKNFNVGNFKTDFTNIDEVKAYSKLSKLIGQRITTDEYHASTGYGGASYDVVSAGSVTPNGMDIVQGVADSGAAIKLVYIQSEIDACKLGASGASGFDNVDIIERAAQLIKAGVVTFSAHGRYELSRTAYMPAGVYIKCTTGNRSFSGNFDDTVQLASQSGGVYVEDFLFFMNIDPQGDTETWVTPFPNIASGGASGISIDGSATAGINGFKFAGSHEFENIDCRFVGSLIRKPSSLYTDKIKAKRLHGRERANATDYLVDLPGSGDAPEIENIESGIVNGASFPAPESGTTRGLRLGPARGALISGLINGNHSFQQGKYDIANLHLEHGVVEVLNGDVTIRDSDIFNEADKPVPIKLISQSAGGFGQRFKFRLSNVQFSSRVESSLGGWPSTLKADLQTNPNFDIEIESCSRRVSTTNNQIVSQQYMGIIVQDENENLLSAFNNYSHVLSKGCEINTNEVLALKSSASLLNGTFGGVSASIATETSTETYAGASGTYYYQAQVLTDNQRAWGRNASNAESSISLTSGGAIPKINIVWSSINFRSALIVRVYKGSVAGSYEQYVDIPIYSCQTLYDNGLALNGFAWQSRAAGVVSSINSGAHGSVLAEAGLATCKQTSLTPPTAGFWKQGDRVEILNPTVPTSGVSQPVAFIRKTSGNAHTPDADWLTVGNYAP
jgi:hypothetical protein